MFHYMWFTMTSLLYRCLCGFDRYLCYDFTSCLSKHADQADSWASKSQPTAKTGITQAKIRKDGKERQGDRDITRSLFSLPLSVYLSFTFSLSFLLCPAAWAVSHGCRSISHCWEAFGMSKGPGTQQPNGFFSTNSASTACSWGVDCRRREQVYCTKQGFPWCSALIDLS